MGNSLEILAEELPVEELIPLLYGNTGGISSNLGAAGIKVPGSAGETSEALYEKVWSSGIDHGRRTSWYQTAKKL